VYTGNCIYLQSAVTYFVVVVIISGHSVNVSVTVAPEHLYSVVIDVEQTYLVEVGAVTVIVLVDVVVTVFVFVIVTVDMPVVVEALATVDAAPVTWALTPREIIGIMRSASMVRAITAGARPLHLLGLMCVGASARAAIGAMKYRVWNGYSFCPTA